jgi:threonine dehydratase
MIPLPEIEAAAQRVYAAMAPTPQYAWPLLARHAGCEVWVKHENHTPTGAFKVRGGINLLAQLATRDPRPAGVISATRGNHGQSLAYASRRHGLPCVIVVPHGNSADKNAAMRAFGAELIEHGEDFDEARVHAAGVAAARGLRFIGPFERELVAGVATYALELFRGAPPLDRVYVPIGCGSGICGLVSARDALGLRTEIVGVVSSGADAYARSFEQRQAVETERAITIADGMAVRVPVAGALEVIWRGVHDVVRVDDGEIADATRTAFDTMHAVLEGAGAAPIAALMKDPGRAGRRIGVVASGGNVDRAPYARLLAG